MLNPDISPLLLMRQAGAVTEKDLIQNNVHLMTPCRQKVMVKNTAAGLEAFYEAVKNTLDIEQIMMIIEKFYINKGLTMRHDLSIIGIIILLGLVVGVLLRGWQSG
ncbi:MAG: hypothetical protein SWH68_11150 [Thermodesulfobacteriota bacterium]|nr:hypothetical protein [Thermodesulfobacteriota bacterium]